MRAGGIQADGGDGKAEGVRAEHADSGAARGIGQAIGGAGDNGGKAVFAGKRFHGGIDGVGRQADHREIGRHGQGGGVADGVERAREAGQHQVGHDLGTGVGLGTDDRDGTRPEQGVGAEAASGCEAWNGHDGRSVEPARTTVASGGPASRGRYSVARYGLRSAGNPPNDVSIPTDGSSQRYSSSWWLDRKPSGIRRDMNVPQLM